MAALLAIDPGLQGTGLAFWSDTKIIQPSWTDVITFRGKGEWIFRASMLSRAISTRLRDSPVADPGKITLVCELMEMHGSARAQMMWKGGDFQRTLVFIGMTVARCERYVDATVLVKPSEWKGQLPKSVAERRIRKILGDKACRSLQIESHAWDAVGIGLWQMKRF